MLFRIAIDSDCKFIAESLKDILKIHHFGRQDIFNACGAKYCETDVKNMILQADKRVYVAVDDERLCGYAICNIVEKGGEVLKPRKVFYLDDLYIVSGTRGHGYGKKFMEFLTDCAISENCVSFELNVWEFKGGAGEFYERCGFTTQRRIMEKTL